MGNTSQKDGTHRDEEPPWWLGCGTSDCRDFGDVCSSNDAAKGHARPGNVEGFSNLRFVPAAGGTNDRIRPFETRLGTSLPGPRGASFVDGAGDGLRKADDSAVDAYHDEAADKYAVGDFDRAEQLYLKALQLNPNHLRSLCNYGALLQNVRQDFNQAEEMYRKALDVDGQDAVALYNYGLLLENARQDFKGAESMYQRALAADPNNVDTLCNYGALIKTIHQDYATSERMYQAALKVSPNHVDTLCNYALLLRDCLNNQTKARELIMRAKELAPTDEWLRLYAQNF